MFETRIDRAAQKMAHDEDNALDQVRDEREESLEAEPLEVLEEE